MENGEWRMENAPIAVFGVKIFFVISIFHFLFSIFLYPLLKTVYQRNTPLSRRKRTKSLLTPVYEVLNSVMTGLEMPEDIELKDRAFRAWDEAVGEAASHTNPFRFRGTTLIVEVDEPAWLTELSMRKADILNRLERAVGKGVVEDIKFEVKKKRPQD